jgi:hypothetical protein
LVGLLVLPVEQQSVPQPEMELTHLSALVPDFWWDLLQVVRLGTISISVTAPLRSSHCNRSAPLRSGS